MKDFFSGALVAALVWVLFELVWYIHLGLIVNDCERYGMFTSPGKIYECRAIEK